MCITSFIEVSAKKTYDLKWKIAPNEEVVYDYSLKYTTDTISPLGPGSSLIPDEVYASLKEFADKYAKHMEKATWKLSFACKNPGVIDLELQKYENEESGDLSSIFKDLVEKGKTDSLPKEDAELVKYLETGDTTNMGDKTKADVKKYEEMSKLIGDLKKERQGKPLVALRGSVYENGDIHSFFYITAQPFGRTTFSSQLSALFFLLYPL